MVYQKTIPQMNIIISPVKKTADHKYYILLSNTHRNADDIFCQQQLKEMISINLNLLNVSDIRLPHFYSILLVFPFSQILH